MNNHNQHRPLAKELTIVISIAVFVIYLVVGGLARQYGYFDGTMMYDLFPAMAFGYMAAFAVGTGIAHFYPDAIPLWLISGAISFGLVTWLEMIDFRWGRRGFGAFLALFVIAVRIILYIIKRIYNRSSR